MTKNIAEGGSDIFKTIFSKSNPAMLDGCSGQNSNGARQFAPQGLYYHHLAENIEHPLGPFG